MNKQKRNTFLYLIRHELFLLKHDYWQKLVDVFIIITTTSLVFGYLLPLLGSPKNYGAFVIAATVPNLCFFESTNHTILMSFNITREKTISSKLILPIETNWVFLSYPIAWGISNMLLIFPLLPFSKLFLQNQLNFSQIDYIRFFTIFTTFCFFYGVFALWLTSILSTIRRLSTLWKRIINPLFMFGGIYYSWQTVYAVSPILAKIQLLNPLIYISEATRSSIFGEANFLPFWNCVLILWILIVCLTFHAIIRLKRRLDCV